uniref:M superfamily MMSK group conopeptide Bt+S3-TP04 n=3 Tax=Conus TaxID=6490 RepID=H2BKR8_CONBE|nr:M superfamily MMSK group conopeptide Bt+S3-TP04 [Conus betulinus]
MMSKLGVLLTICMLLIPLTAVLLDRDQPADRHAERMKYMLRAMSPWFDPVKRCCKVLCESCTPCC